MDDFICPFCRKILLKPIIVSCGHTFCKHCATRASNSQKKCPHCDTTFKVSPHSKPNVIIQNLIEKNFPKEFKKRSRETPKEEAKRSVSSIPLYIKENLLLLPGAKGVISNPEMKYLVMIQHSMMGNRVFGMLSSYNGRWVGSLLEITSLDMNNPLNVVVNVVAKERFIIENVFPDQDESQTIDVNRLGPNEINSDSIYFGWPIFIRDSYDYEPEIKGEILSFIEGCLNLLGIDEQNTMRGLFVNGCDKSFFACAMLNLSHEDLLKAYFSTSKSERYEICRTYTFGKKIDRTHIRDQKYSWLKTHFTTIMIVLALFILLFFGRK